MRRITKPTSRLRLLGAACAVAALFPSAAQAACPDQPTRQVFSRFGDANWYFAAPGGTFEAGAAPWTPTGADPTPRNQGDLLNSSGGPPAPPPPAGQGGFLPPPGGRPRAPPRPRDRARSAAVAVRERPAPGAASRGAQGQRPRRHAEGRAPVPRRHPPRRQRREHRAVRRLEAHAAAGPRHRPLAVGHHGHGVRAPARARRQRRHVGRRRRLHRPVPALMTVLEATTGAFPRVERLLEDSWEDRSRRASLRELRSESVAALLFAVA